MALPTRRFGRTELEIPLLSLGGMRFQQSWTDLPADEITSASQTQLEATLKRAVDLGLVQEVARHGRQVLVLVLGQLVRRNRQQEEDLVG